MSQGDKWEYAMANAIPAAMLRRQLEFLDDDDLVFFTDTTAGEPLLFSRVKTRGNTEDGSAIAAIELWEAAEAMEEAAG